MRPPPPRARIRATKRLTSGAVDGPGAQQNGGAMSTTNRERLGTDQGVVYGTAAGEPLLLDACRPPVRPAPRPAVVLVHGGGMWTGSRADMAEPARRLARAGYVTFAPDLFGYGETAPHMCDERGLDLGDVGGARAGHSA